MRYSNRKIATFVFNIIKILLKIKSCNFLDKLLLLNMNLQATYICVSRIKKGVLVSIRKPARDLRNIPFCLILTFKNLPTSEKITVGLKHFIFFYICAGYLKKVTSCKVFLVSVQNGN